MLLLLGILCEIVTNVVSLDRRMSKGSTAASRTNSPILPPNYFDHL